MKGTQSNKSKHPPFLKKSKKKQAKVGRVEKGETHLPPYGIGADMKQSHNY
jgi:hypothetical protein